MIVQKFRFTVPFDEIQGMTNLIIACTDSHKIVLRALLRKHVKLRVHKRVTVGANFYHLIYMC